MGSGVPGDERSALLERSDSPTAGDTVASKPEPPPGPTTWTAEALSLLKWSMLAACTIGPGTVVVCSKGGSEFKLQLLWTLLAASFVAFVMQKEAATLTIVSGKSFGETIRLRFGRATDDRSGMAGSVVPGLGFGVVVGIWIGNAMYEANNFVGGMSALYVLYDNVGWYRWLFSIVTGGITMLALLAGNVDQIGQMLGLIVVSMTIVFMIAAARVPLDSSKLGRGLLPNVPGGASVTVLSMMGTTCIPFNTFLAASMTRGVTLGQMRRGVAFASVMTAIISMLIVVIGSDIEIQDDKEFGVEDLGYRIGESLGDEIKVLFCIGLYAAAYSSAITVALGAALSAKQVFFDGREKEELPPAQCGCTANARWDSTGLYFRGVLAACVGFGVLVSAAGLPTVEVIIVAQVVNGLLLPAITVCLYVCRNATDLVPVPPGLLNNVLLLICVFVTLFLAFHLIMDELSLAAASAQAGNSTNGTNAAGLHGTYGPARAADAADAADPEGAWGAEVNVGTAAGLAAVSTAAVAFYTHRGRGDAYEVVG